MLPSRLRDRERARTSTDSAPRHRLTFVVLTLACLSAGLAGEVTGLPAPFLLGALVLSAAYSMRSRHPCPFPRPIYTASQALVGAAMGSCLRPAQMAAIVPALGPLLAVIAATVLLSAAGAYALRRAKVVSGRSAALGMAPGGSAAIVATASEVDADAHTVAFAQYVRVAVVALSAPLVVACVRGQALSGFSLQAPDLSWGPTSFLGLLTLGAVTTVGVMGGRRLALPAPALLGPMVVGGLVTLTGLAPASSPQGLIADVVFAWVGMEVGLRFTRSSVLHVRRAAWPLLLATMAVSLGCAGMAWTLAVSMHMPFVDAYLATTPGGINAVLAAAAAAHANVPLISSVQSLRLFAVVLITPPALRLLQRQVLRLDAARYS